MSLLGSLRVGLVALSCTAAVLLAGPAGADGLDDESFPPTSDPGDGFMGLFFAIFVIGLLVSIGVTIWRVSAARDLARQAGMDPDVATGMTLLDENGLSATYLASSLRTAMDPEPASTPTTSSAAARLGELKELLDGGLVTQAEYDQRRQAIIDSV